MLLKNKMFQLALAFAIGLTVLALPRPDGTLFEILGDPEQKVLAQVQGDFELVKPEGKQTEGYFLKVKQPGASQDNGERLQEVVKDLGLEEGRVEWVNGLSPKAKRFLAMLAFLVILFVLEPIPLEITAIGIGVLLTGLAITDIKDAWAAYMHPVVVFIMVCLIFAIALEKAGITKRLARAVARRAGDSVTKFTFILAVTLGLASGIMHDAAAAAIGIATMLPLMRAAGIKPNTNTARFMIISVAFACSSGGMGTLVGGGRCMVAAAFLKEFTGIELTFFDWFLYAFPGALITVPAAVGVVWLVFRPNPWGPLLRVGPKV